MFKPSSNFQGGTSFEDPVFVYLCNMFVILSYLFLAALM